MRSSHTTPKHATALICAQRPVNTTLICPLVAHLSSWQHVRAPRRQAATTSRHTRPLAESRATAGCLSTVCLHRDKEKQGKGCCRSSWRRSTNNLTFLGPRGSSVVAQTSICLPSACLRASSSTSGSSGDAFVPFFIHCVHITRARRPTNSHGGARASHHHQANVKPATHATATN